MSDDRLERIEIKLDKQGETLASIDVTLAKQHASLADHMRRTELLEEIVTPLKTKADMVEGVLKLIGGLATVAAIVEAGVMLLSYINKSGKI